MLMLAIAVLQWERDLEEQRGWRAADRRLRQERDAAYQAYRDGRPTAGPRAMATQRETAEAASPRCCPPVNATAACR